MGALQYVDQSDYAGLLLRRSYADLTLPGSLMQRAEEWLTGTGARWIDKEKTWVFPSGARLTFGYLATEMDKYRYKSAEFQYIGFDELTQFTESMYTYLITRLRRLSSSKIPLRMRGASNPGDIGHEWVRRRFVDYQPALTPQTTPQERLRLVRPFIPARLDDNPFLDATEYKTNFDEVDAVTREQLLGGDWNVMAQGSKFFRYDFQIIRPNEVPSGLHWLRYWDLAATEPKPTSKKQGPDFTAGAKLGYDATTGNWYLADMRRWQADPGPTEQRIVQVAEEDGIGVRIYMEQEPGASGKALCDHYRRNLLQRYMFRGYRSTGSKEVRAAVFSAAVSNHRFYVVNGRWTEDFIRECEMFPNAGWHDDQVDAVSGGMQKVKGKRRIQAVGSSLEEIEASEQRAAVRHSMRIIA